MSNEKADEVIEDFFPSLLSRCRIGTETLMKGGEFVFAGVHLL